MQLKRPDLVTLLTFFSLILAAVVVTIVHAWLATFVKDPGELDWMNGFSSTAGLAALGVLGYGIVRPNGNGKTP